MQQKGKFALSVKRLWVSSRKGYPTGYGDAPEKAVADSERKKREINESMSRTQKKMSSLISQNEHMKERDGAAMRLYDEMSRETIPALENTLNEERAEGWLLACMVAMGERDPGKALERLGWLGMGVRIGHLEHAAAKRLAPILDRFAQIIQAGLG